MKLKLSDLWAALYFAAITAFLFAGTQIFISLTKSYPIPMGFLKFGLLATFGECLKNRIGPAKKWIPGKIGIKFLVWGMFGVWITLAFPYADGGVTALGKLWPDTSAISKSLWINILGGYAFFMMYTHYWIDTIMATGFCWPWEILGKPATERWGRIVLISMVLFWLPAHTITFSLAPEYRVIMAAYLSVALGLILSFAAGRKT